MVYPHNPGMDDILPWLTPVLAFLGAALGGIGTEWYSHQRQDQRAKNDRQRQVLTDLQRSLLDHILNAAWIYVGRGAHFQQTGEWPPLIIRAAAAGPRGSTANPAHIVARVEDEELRRLVRELLEAINTVTVLAQSSEEANQAMTRMVELNVQSRERIEMLLARIP